MEPSLLWGNDYPPPQERSTGVKRSGGSLVPLCDALRIMKGILFPSIAAPNLNYTPEGRSRARMLLTMFMEVSQRSMRV